MSEPARGGSTELHRALAILLARLVLGLTFFMAGVWKVVTLGPVEHARRFFVEPYAESFLPSWALWSVGSVVPLVELVAGGLLVLGLFRTGTMMALGTILVVVTFGHLLAVPMYELNTHVMPRTVLLLFLLWTPGAADRFCLDRVRRFNR